MRLALAIAVVVIVLDQITKWLVLGQLADAPQGTELLPVFNLVLVWNRGVSFGLFSGNAEATRWVLVAVAVVIALGLTLWLRRVERPWMGAAIGLVIGGALGNVIDRLRFGAVVDFLDFHIAGYHWPAFNVADSAISIGVLILLFESLFARQPLPRAPHQRDLP